MSVATCFAQFAGGGSEFATKEQFLAGLRALSPTLGPVSEGEAGALMDPYLYQGVLRLQDFARLVCLYEPTPFMGS